MRLRRLRLGEWVAAAGAALLLAGLSLHCVSERGTGRSGWASLGWLTLALASAAALAAAWLVAATASARPTAQAMAADVLTTVVGAGAVLALIVRIAIAQPGADATTDIRAGACVALAGAVLVVAGAWYALRDERTDAPESAFVPPPARPAPPPAEPREQA